MVHTKFRSEETWRDFNKKDSADFRSEFLMGYLRVICVAYKQNMRLFFQKFWLTKSSQKFAPVINLKWSGNQIQAVYQSNISGFWTETNVEESIIMFLMVSGLEEK